MPRCELDYLFCTEEATTAVEDGPYGERLPACATCATVWATREPSDEDLANGHGMEGGCGYDPAAAAEERRRR